MFFIDVNQSIAWSHPAEIYFINAETPTVYTKVDVNQFPGLIDLERFRSYFANGNPPDDEDQADTLITYPTPDPHLKAILISGNRVLGGYCEPLWYFNIARWYVMLKSMGFSRIDVFHDDTTEVDENNFTHIRWVPHDDPGQMYQDTLWTPSQDLDNDGNNDIIGTSRYDDVKEGLADLAGDVEPEDRIVIYITNHGFEPGQQSPFGDGELDEYSIKLFDEMLSADSLYSMLLEFNNAAELFVFLEACHAGGIFDANAALYSQNFPHGHFAGACVDTQSFPFEADDTFWLYGHPTYHFTSYIMGSYPQLLDQREENGNYLDTQPWRKGKALEYPDPEDREEERHFLNGACFDAWDSKDRNSDLFLSFREAIEYTWAATNYNSGFDLRNGNNQEVTRYPQVVFNLEHGYDTYYFWPANNSAYCSENDSSGTVDFRGRGGYANWGYAGWSGNWNSSKPYIINQKLTFPAMATPGTITIGAEESTTEFLIYPGKDIIFERGLGEGNIDNVTFEAYTAGAANIWNGITVENTDFDMETCEISGADVGIDVILDDDEYDVILDDIEISFCNDGANFENTDSDGTIYLSNSSIHDCDYGIDAQDVYNLKLDGNVIYDIDIIGLFANNVYSVSPEGFTDNEIYSTGNDAIWCEDDNVIEFSLNDIYNNDYAAISSIGTGNLLILETPGNWEDDTPNNLLHDNDDYGIYVSSAATGTIIWAGDASLGYEGWNRIEDNASGAVYNGLAGMTIEAEGNWWGQSPPNAGDFDGAGSVDYSPWWTSSVDDDLKALFYQFAEGEYNQVIEGCREIIEDSPNSHAAMGALDLWDRSLRRTDANERQFGEIYRTVNAQRNGNSDLVRYASIVRARNLSSRGEFNTAIDTLESILADIDERDESVLPILVRAASILSDDLNDIEGALDIYDFIIDRYPDSRYARLASARANRLDDMIDGDGNGGRNLLKGLVPDENSLESISPNPFNNATEISFKLAESGRVNLRVFDIMGREVANLVTDYLTPGKHSFTWNARDLSTGMYLIHLTTEEGVLTEKAILLR